MQETLEVVVLFAMTNNLDDIILILQRKMLPSSNKRHQSRDG